MHSVNLKAAEQLKEDLERNRRVRLAQAAELLRILDEEAEKARQSAYQTEIERAEKIIAETSTKLRENDRDLLDWMEVMELSPAEVIVPQDRAGSIKIAPTADAAKHVAAFFQAAGLCVQIWAQQRERIYAQQSRNGIYVMNVAKR